MWRSPLSGRSPRPHRRDPRPQSSAAGSPVAGAHLSAAMPGRAADRGQVPFCSAAEESRAGVEDSEGGGGQERPGARQQRQDIVWRNVVLMSLLHLAAVYSLVLIPKAKPLTLLWGKSRGRWRGRAGARGVAGLLSAVRSPLRAPLAGPGRPGPLGLQLPSLQDGQVFLPRYFQLLPPLRVCSSGRSGPLPEGEREGPRVLRRSRCARRGARGETLGAPELRFERWRTGGPKVSPKRVPGALLSAAFRLLSVLRGPRTLGPS